MISKQRDAQGASAEFVWIVGDPVAQVKAPELMNPLYAATGCNITVIPALVRSGDLRTVFDGARLLGNLRGWIVTVPHKIPLTACVDELSAAARIAGAVNAIRFRNGKAYGDLFDGSGFVAGLADRRFPIRGSSALILGAGGVGAAIALALAESGAARVSIFDIDLDRSRQLVARLTAHGPESTRFDIGSNMSADGFQLVVNASPVGMTGDAHTPIDPGLLTPSQAVAEVVMSPELTPFLLAARQIGCDIHPGKQVLAGQLQRLVEFFR